jgi:hypothetical protein
MRSPFGRLARAAFVALLGGLVCLLADESSASIPPETRHTLAGVRSRGIFAGKSIDVGWMLLTQRGRGRWDEGRSTDRRYREWQSLSPEQKEMLRQQMQRYRELSPQERELYQRRHQQWQELSPEERNRIQEDLKHWKNLSPQEQEAIRRRFGR